VWWRPCLQGNELKQKSIIYQSQNNGSFLKCVKFSCVRKDVVYTIQRQKYCGDVLRV